MAVFQLASVVFMCVGTVAVVILMIATSWNVRHMDDDQAEPRWLRIVERVTHASHGN